MTQYLLTVHGPVQPEDEFGGYGSKEAMERGLRRPPGPFNEQLREDDHWVFESGLTGGHDGPGRRRAVRVRRW